MGRGFGSARCGEIRQSVASYSRAARGSAKTGAFESLALRASCGVDAEKRRTQRAWRCARKSASVDASSREDGTHPPRTALAVETRRVARLFAASMSMPSNPSVAFSYAGPPSRIIVAPRHAPAGQKMPTLGRSVPRKFPRHLAKQLVSVCCHVRRARCGTRGPALPLAPCVLGTPLVVTMNPAMLARNPVVVATAARPRVAARRASAATVRQADGLVSRASVGSARRATRCAASESEADKTVSALDAILAGSQDEPAPEEVRRRASPRPRTQSSTRSGVSRKHPSALRAARKSLLPCLFSLADAERKRPTPLASFRIHLRSRSKTRSDPARLLSIASIASPSNNAHVRSPPRRRRRESASPAR